jgi:hypothetical protein
MKENNWPPCELDPRQSTPNDPITISSDSLRRCVVLVFVVSRVFGARQNHSWPPVFPFIHHAPDELPEQHRTVGKLLYAQWLALAATLIVNLLGCIFLLIAGSSEGGWVRRCSFSIHLCHRSTELFPNHWSSKRFGRIEPRLLAALCPPVSLPLCLPRVIISVSFRTFQQPRQITQRASTHRVHDDPRWLLPRSADTAAAGGYLPVIGVLSFLLWYRPIYLGLDRTEGKAMAFFFCERGGHFQTFLALLLLTIRYIRDVTVHGLDCLSCCKS